MNDQDKNNSNNEQLKKFKRYLVPCPNCGRDILYHMTQCPFCKKEVALNKYNPMDPDVTKKIKLVLGVIGFIIVIILLFVVK